MDIFALKMMFIKKLKLSLFFILFIICSDSSCYIKNKKGFLELVRKVKTTHQFAINHFGRMDWIRVLIIEIIRCIKLVQCCFLLIIMIVSFILLFSFLVCYKSYTTGMSTRNEYHNRDYYRCGLCYCSYVINCVWNHYYQKNKSSMEITISKE